MGGIEEDSMFGLVNQLGNPQGILGVRIDGWCVDGVRIRDDEIIGIVLFRNDVIWGRLDLACWVCSLFLFFLCMLKMHFNLILFLCYFNLCYWIKNVEKWKIKIEKIEFFMVIIRHFSRFFRINFLNIILLQIKLTKYTNVLNNIFLPKNVFWNLLGFD